MIRDDSPTPEPNQSTHVDHSPANQLPAQAGSTMWRWLKFCLLLAFVGGAFWIVRGTSLRDYLEPKQLLTTIDTLDPWLKRLAYVVIYSVGCVLFLPGTLLSFVGAVVFGVWEGTLLTWMAATLGATLAFFVARLLGRDFVESLFAGSFKEFDERIREQGFWGLFLVRLAPIFPFFAINFGCGLTAIRLRDYVLATAFGILPGVFVYQFLFAKFGDAILREGISRKHLTDPAILAALGLFAAFTVIGLCLSRKLKPKSTTQNAPKK